jgi:hypothetical protein
VNVYTEVVDLRYISGSQIFLNSDVNKISSHILRDMLAREYTLGPDRPGGFGNKLCN